MKIAAITDIGSCRQENQDNYCAQQLPGGTAWGIVCDGMGGVNGGRIAAHIATDTMQQYFARQMRSLQPGGEKSFIMRGFDITNRAVYEKATSDPEMMGMGTTGVCAYAGGGLAHEVHAGDSRALGVSANIVPEYNRCEIEVGDILLLCSDGLTNMISDEEIALVLREVPFFEAPSILVDRALQAGGQDNITVLLMGVEITEVNHG